MSNAFDFVMTEHPSWIPFEKGHRRVFALAEGGRYLCTVSGREIVGQSLTPGGGPILDAFTTPKGHLAKVPELEAALNTLGSVARFRNPDLWDAVGTAIMRQVIRAGQSKKLYRAFCAAHGERVRLPDGDSYALFPRPSTVLELHTDQFASLGMAFKRGPLVAAAKAYLEHGARWQDTHPETLTQELQTVPRIGPWTAHAALADWSNNWALYPYADLAVRTWATRAAPRHNWPSSEGDFGPVWRALGGDHLSDITLMTLAWGSKRGDIG